MLPESTSVALDAFRLPLSAIAEAQIVVIVGDDAVGDRAPVVELWLKAAARNGAEVVHVGPTGSVKSQPGTGAATLIELAAPGNELGGRVRAAERAILIWSGPGGGGGARLAEAADALGLAGKLGSGAFHLPATPNGQGVAIAWAAAADEDETNPEPIELLIVSGDEAASSPSVRALAERAAAVVAITMFHGLAVGWADIVLPATAALERDGTLLNLEGRLQRLRRAVVASAPTSSHGSPSSLSASTSSSHRMPPRSSRSCRGGCSGASPSRRSTSTAELPSARRRGARRRAPSPRPPPRGGPGEHFLGELRLVRYRPLFSGPSSSASPSSSSSGRRQSSSSRRRMRSGARSERDTVDVRSNGTSVELRARVNRTLVEGVARVSDEHAGDLHQMVEVVKP